MDKAKRKTNKAVQQLSVMLEDITSVIEDDRDDKADMLAVQINEAEKRFLKVEEAFDDALDAARNREEMSAISTEKITHAVQYNQLIKRAKTVLAELQPLPSASTERQPPVERQRVDDIRLPTIHIEPFSGDYTQWPAFHDMFTTLVHGKTHLSGAEKLQLLKNSLRGNAAKKIANITVTHDNYAVAWNLLKDVYENKRVIVSKLLAKLTDAAPIKSCKFLPDFVDSVNSTYRALEAMNIPAEELYSYFLCHVIQSKLDEATAQSWEEKQNCKVPKFTDLMDFLREKVAHIEIAPGNEFNHILKERERRGTSQSIATCPVCQLPHKLYHCESFKKTSIPDKYNLLKSSQRCWNCLEPGHGSPRCRASGCKKCGKRHHTLLHEEKSGNSGNIEPDKQTGSSSSSLNATVAKGDCSTTLTILGTAKIYIMDADGNPIAARALLDQGSQSNIITEACARKLRLPIKPAETNILGVGGKQSNAVKGKVCMTVKNKNGEFEYNGHALVMEYVTCDHPIQEIHSTLKVTQGLDLADTEFTQPGPIDVLLGVDIYTKACRRGLRHPRRGEPAAINTAFGWVIMGTIPTDKVVKPKSRNFKSVNVSAIDPSRYWALEEVPKVPLRTHEDRKCEAFYTSTTTRGENGRYCVRLPRVSNEPDLGESRQQALKRFYGLERKFERNPEFAIEYKRVINEYLQLEHMEEVPQTNSLKPGYYIPHHAVIKEASKTTKLRVVFDASAKTTSGKSLNDNLLTGPQIQDELFHILIRFRKHRIALTADIEKMYRMVMLHPEDRQFQRIVWRSSRNEPVRDFQLTTVSFGVKSAPFLAIRTLHQLAEDEEPTFPEAAVVLKRDFYVDDLLTGADDIEEVRLLQSDLQQLLARGGFNLTKWTSNEPKALLQALKSATSHSPVQLQIEGEVSKTLGLHWQPTSDVFQFTYVPPTNKQHTKRSMLSDIARLFDPLGWLSPVTISGKIMFQKLWRLDLDWDTPVPPEQQTKWTEYIQSLSCINTLRIKRCIKGNSQGKFILCGFSDASEVAYGACAYLCTVNEHETTAHLIAAKTKVASLHATTLPRLELCGALLLAQLLEAIENSLQLPIEEVHAFTDSAITLQWITNTNVRWKAFVANRVAAIHDKVPHAKWHHVPGKDNIADCVSRGISAADLCDLKAWWNGPSLLYQPLKQQCDRFAPSEDANKEARNLVVLNVTESERSDDFILRFSKFFRLQRTVAIIRRFIHIYLKRPHDTGPITTSELEAARKCLIRRTQSNAYQALLKKGQVPERLQALCPVVDRDGIVRVGGRIKNAEVTTDQKQPILLPKDAHITLLILRQIHEETLHGGPQIMMATFKQQYWVVGLKHVVKRVLNGCVRCQRLRAKTCMQLMGDLPKSRVTQARPFIRTGCDFMGPFWMKTKTGRGAKRFKSYVALFVCFTTRAIHLEVVSDMTTPAFLAALKRFIARRGKPSDMYSDLGTNLVGGNNELKRYMELTTSDPRNKEIADNLAPMGITWHFNPGGAPHFGGLWEAGVKSTKYHLKRIVGDSALTYEELHTVLCQIEAVLNSRPLVEMSPDPSDYVALTPGHFLIGEPLTAHPEPNYETTKETHLTRWSLLQKMVQHFWRRWHNEYLTRLQQRPKWLKPLKNLQAGELVLLKEDNLPPLHWSLGRVSEVHPGADGNVRVVSVKTVKGLYKRPITKVCRLPDTSDE